MEVWLLATCSGHSKSSSVVQSNSRQNTAEHVAVTDVVVYKDAFADGRRSVHGGYPPYPLDSCTRPTNMVFSSLTGSLTSQYLPDLVSG